ncbi:MAG: alternative ribosome rescue aminoacyl-tRNA hydrolase ArfB [Burkholderiaceae bacterium]
MTESPAFSNDAAASPGGLRVRLDEVEITAVRSQGAGGQNVNKVASAIHLRFDVAASSLPESVKTKLLERPDQRRTRDGVIVIKAQRFRTQEANRVDALARLQAMIDDAARAPRRRIATRPTRASVRRRVDDKQHRGRIKATRGRVGRDGGEH